MAPPMVFLTASTIANARETIPRSSETTAAPDHFSEFLFAVAESSWSAFTVPPRTTEACSIHATTSNTVVVCAPSGLPDLEAVFAEKTATAPFSILSLSISAKAYSHTAW